MTIMFAPATRTAQRARIALAGPSGSGKTYTALALATHLGTTAVIDTERGSASKYVGVNGWQFHTWAPQSFSPTSLVEALGAAAGAGFDVVIVDSLSHYWMGVDGMLEQADRRTNGGNSFSGWKEVRPDERRMIDALVSYPGHVIVTLRVKTEYVVEKDDRGKSVPRKVGMRPEQREGIEYEFDVVGDLDLDNVLRVSKTRIPLLRRAVIAEPSAPLADTIRDWLADGADVDGPLAYREQALAPNTTRESLLALLGTVRAAGLFHAPVVDQAGAPTVLGDLIGARGRALDASPPAQPTPRSEPEPDTPPAPAAPATDWDVLLQQAAGDVEALQQLWRRAYSAEPDNSELLHRIGEAGKAAASAAAEQPADAEPVDEQETGSAPVAEEPAEQAPPADGPSERQLTKLHTQLSRLAVLGDEKHATVSMLVGRKIQSTKDLTSPEINGVIDKLDDCLKRPEPVRELDLLLAELHAADEAQGQSTPDSKES